MIWIDCFSRQVSSWPVTEREDIVEWLENLWLNGSLTSALASIINGLNCFVILLTGLPDCRELLIDFFDGSLSFDCSEVGSTCRSIALLECLHFEAINPLIIWVSRLLVLNDVFVRTFVQVKSSCRSRLDYVEYFQACFKSWLIKSAWRVAAFLALLRVNFELYLRTRGRLCWLGFLKDWL